MSKRLTYREQLDRARQQAAVAALREAARLVAEGHYGASRHLMVEAHDLCVTLGTEVAAKLGRRVEIGPFACAEDSEALAAVKRAAAENAVAAMER